ncbi:hypothetical protein VIGAN_06236700, partial [Vigna angularis var. angularis]
MKTRSQEEIVSVTNLLGLSSSDMGFLQLLSVRLSGKAARPPPLEDPKPLFTKASPPPVSLIFMLSSCSSIFFQSCPFSAKTCSLGLASPNGLTPLGFPTFPSPPSLDTDRDRGCRTSLGLPPPAPTLSLPTLDSPFFLFQSFESAPPLEPNPI